MLSFPTLGRSVNPDLAGVARVFARAKTNPYNIIGKSFLLTSSCLKLRLRPYVRCRSGICDRKPFKEQYDATTHPVPANRHGNIVSSTQVISSDDILSRTPESSLPALPATREGGTTEGTIVVSSSCPVFGQTVLLRRRHVMQLTATLLMAAVPVPFPVPEPSPGRMLPSPPFWTAASATAAVEPAIAGESQQNPAAPRLGREVVCYVAPEPLDPAGSGVAAPDQRHFLTLAAAVEACPRGGVVLVAAGRYKERLQLSKPLTLRAWPTGARVEVVWETTEPYQSTLEISAPGASGLGPKEEGGGSGTEVVVEGFTVRHSSKSVANNYGVFIRGGSPKLLDCDISSTTGAGVGVEGASPKLVGCRIHDCARQGIAIFGALFSLDLDPVIDPGLLYGMTGGVVRNCDVYGNALDGVLVRSGASPDILDNLIHSNVGFGVNLQDCSGRYEGNTVYGNGRGSVAVSTLFELDAGDLAGSNSLRGILRRL